MNIVCRSGMQAKLALWVPYRLAIISYCSPQAKLIN